MVYGKFDRLRDLIAFDLFREDVYPAPVLLDRIMGLISDFEEVKDDGVSEENPEE